VKNVLSAVIAEFLKTQLFRGVLLVFGSRIIFVITISAF